MPTILGQNKKGVKLQNQALALKLIATHPGISRVDIAKISGLTKMTIGNLVAEMMAHGLIEEVPASESGSSVNSTPVGRSPIALKIAGTSPCILGVSIKRGLYQFVLADLSGAVIDSVVRRDNAPMNNNTLLSIVKSGIDKLRRRNNRRVLGVGIASIGPVDSIDGVILNPANFPGVRDLPIVDLMKKHSDLPVFLISDGNSGALAEKLYGMGRDVANYFYLHIMYGIGAGLVLDNKLYAGLYGQSGEIGHTTINFAGPRCDCGNTGCLELYANIRNMRDHIRTLSLLYPDSGVAQLSEPALPEIIDAANSGDNLAIAALDRFCDYLSHAVANTVLLLDVRHVIVDFQSTVPGQALETLLAAKMSASFHKRQRREFSIERSRFNGSLTAPSKTSA